MTNELRPELEALPTRLRGLPVHRGYPVPWFVAWVNGEPEFRAADAKKLEKAIRFHCCWVCGETLGKYMTFVIGPMCGVNRISAEATCHRECAQWSARNCPFLSKPHMTRRENALPEGTEEAPGFAIKRNPGVTLLWTTLSYQLLLVDHGVLFQIGEPTNLEWWAEGKPASREQVVASVESGLPTLLEPARQEPGGVEKLMAGKAWLESVYP